MSRNSFTAGVLCTAAVISFAIGPRLLGQTVADQSTTDEKAEKTEEVVKLSPFIVESTEGENTYRANSTLAGTRVKTDLNDVASAISVVTSQFLKDTAVKNSQDLLVYTPSTEVSGIAGNYSGFGGQKTYNESSKLINPSNNNRVRGLDAADNTRDYFLTDIPWDSFNVGRIDLQRGPNSILFGVGSPAGIINASINGASYKTAYKIENSIDEYGSLRNMGDFNQVILPNQLALRISLLDDMENYQQKPAYNHQKRVYTALRFDRELLGEGNHTSVNVKFEDGRVHSNNPRILPPNDMITPWFDSTYNKVTVNTGTVGNGYLSSTSPAILLLRPGGVASLQGASSGSDVKSYFTGGSSTPSLVISGSLSGGPGWIVQAIRPLAMPTYGQYAAANLAGGSFYQDKVLTDSTVFDFFNNLLDGENKREWQSWRTQNIDLQQTFFHDKLAFDFTYDRQDYTSGQSTLLAGGYYAIGMEVNEILEDGSANPYLGRPYVAGSDALGNYYYNTLRQSKRGIVTVDLKSEDYFGKNWFSYILGRSVFTGLANEDERDYKMVQWAEHATTPDLITMYFGTAPNVPNTIAGNRIFDWIYYTGPSLMSASTAHGANLSPINVRLTPAGSNVVRYFDGTWNTQPGASNYVDPDALTYNYVDYNTGENVDPAKQSDNPANYVGWRNGPVNWLSASNPADFPSLVIGGNRQNYRDISQGFTWQGYLLGGDLVPTFGWRKDRVINYDTNAQPDRATSIAPLDYPLDPAGRREATGQSRNWSGVYHLPKKLTSWLPWGMNISLFYNESSNFKADAPRRNLTGNIIPNPEGNTREKGFMISLLDDRLTLKANWFRTTVSNATLASGGG
ncbi:MAG: TonB-dependent receptor plug domain-containing protein, partial [Opitutaceae bacterium]